MPLLKIEDYLRDWLMKEDLEKAKKNCTDIVPADNDKLITWLSGEGTIELCSQKKSNKVEAKIIALLKMAHTKKNADIVETALITDKSTLGDFFWSEKDQELALKRLQKKLGKKADINFEDYLWKLVKQLDKEIPGWDKNV